VGQALGGFEFPGGASFTFFVKGASFSSVELQQQLDQQDEPQGQDDHLPAIN
jgi:hypothetical protein